MMVKQSQTSLRHLVVKSRRRFVNCSLTADYFKLILDQLPNYRQSYGHLSATDHGHKNSGKVVVMVAEFTGNTHRDRPVVSKLWEDLKIRWRSLQFKSTLSFLPTMNLCTIGQNPPFWPSRQSDRNNLSGRHLAKRELRWPAGNILLYPGSVSGVIS